MPTYDFTCTKCGHTEELRRRLEDRATGARCSKCDGLMKRKIAAPGIHYRGDGWTGAQRRG